MKFQEFRISISKQRHRDADGWSTSRHLVQPGSLHFLVEVTNQPGPEWQKRLVTNAMWRPRDIIKSIASCTQIYCESTRSFTAVYELSIQTESKFRISFSWDITLFQCVITSRRFASMQCPNLQRSTGNPHLYRYENLKSHILCFYLLAAYWKMHQHLGL